MEKTQKKNLKKEESKKPEENFEKKFLEAQDNYLRARADYENLQKRSKEEILRARENGIVSLAEDLLPVIDNFELSFKNSDNKEMFIKGIELIHKNLIEVLKEHKIESFEVEVGHNFDMKIHDPVLVEKKGDFGKVLGVVRKGFKHKDKILRSARVEVKRGE